MESILWGDFGEGESDGWDEFVWGASLGGAEGGFDFAPHFFDRVEIRGVGREEEHLGSGLGNEFERWFTLVRREVVHDDEVARPEGGTEDFGNVGAEDFGVGRSGDAHASCGAVQANGGDHGGGLPMAAGGAGVTANAARGAPAQAGHVRLGTTFIEEDEPRRIEAALPPPPLPARPGDVGPVLFTGAECLFLYESPIFTST